MIYFTPDLLDFLSELKENNNREWFNSQKSRYIKSVKEPFEVFIADLIEAMSPHYDSLAITPKESIFRIYRDVRFSKNKAPYKVQVSAVVNPGGRKSIAEPGIYIEITPDHMRVYSGIYMLDTKELRNLRGHIAHNLEEFETLITEPKFEKVFGEIRGEKNKILAKEFRDDAEAQPLLFNKQFYYFTQWSPEVVLEQNLIEKVVETYLVAKPLSEFLYEGIH